MNALNYTILLVEDDPNEVLLLQRAFQKANCTTPLCVARDGQEAIDYLTRDGKFTDETMYPEPTLMLLDLKMPRKNGFEVLGWLRQQPGLKRLIVVVLSSSNQVADINRAFDLGTNSYFVKPGDFDTLIDLVKTLDAYWARLNQNPDLQPDTGPWQRQPVLQN